MLIVHATALALPFAPPFGVLLRGEPGSGKSDLALRLIAEHGASLVADDQTQLDRRSCGEAAAVLDASPLATNEGLLEARGVGIVRLPFLPSCPIGLVIDCLPLGASPERLPELGAAAFAGVEIPALSLAALEPSAPAKTLLAARAIAQGLFAER